MWRMSEEMNQEVNQEKHQQQCVNQNQVRLPDYLSIITNDIKEVPEFLKALPKHSQIYLIGDHEYYHPKVLIIKSADNNVREISGLIYKHMFENRLVNVSCNENCIEIKNEIANLIALDKSFAFGNGGLASIENFWINLKHIVNCPNSGSLKGILKGKSVVIVNSGPSLNKNIDVLKEYQDKVVIIAAGSSVGALWKHGIIADYVVCIDPFQLLEDCVLPYVTEKTTLLCSTNTYYGLVDKFPGPKVFYYNASSISIASDLVKYLDVKHGVYTSATCTTPAFNLALYMEASEIIFIGLDMCIYGDQVYADGVLPDTMKDVYEVESIDGRKMYTYTTYREVWNYFNTIVPKIKDRTIINATEDGLGIAGALVMTLQEVANKYFKNDNDEIITIPDIVGSNINKGKILEELKIIKDDLQELVKYIGFYRKYIDSLIESGIKFKFIETEVNEFFSNLLIKKVMSYIEIFVGWIWFLLPISATIEDKTNALNLTEDILVELLRLVEVNIEEIDEINKETEIKKEDGSIGY
jgi:hypothetical protein